MKRLLLLVLVFILGLMSVNAYTCYQESANTSNQTGLDGSCGLNYTGTYVLKDSNLNDKISDVSKLKEIYKTDNIEVIKTEIFTDLKVNDASKKEAVFTMDTSKIVEEKSLEIVFNEVCGNVINYTLSVKDNDYTVNANIESALCKDGSYGYKIDWMPKIKIGENELINTKWAWWNQTIRLNNLNQYYIIIEATNVNTSYFNINNCSIFNLSSTEWFLYENYSNNYSTSRAQVIKTMFYGSNGLDARVNSTYIQGLVALKTGYLNDVGKYGFYANSKTTGIQSANQHSYVGTFNDTSNNYNCSSWSNIVYAQGGASCATSYGRWENPTNTILNNIEGCTSNTINEIGINTLSDDSNNPSTVRIDIMDKDNNDGLNIDISSLLLCKGNISWAITVGAPTVININYRTYGIPALSYLGLSEYFGVSFIKWNGSYSNVNITMTNGTATLNFTSDLGYITTTILKNDSSLWNISYSGNGYYTPTYINYNVSTDLNIDRTVTQTLSALTGVFSEKSTLTLNLSKSSNQSYLNAKLIYNGTVYSSPTQTDYTNYTLFTQVITNSAIGNFTYAWNVSLIDYSDIFNFTTVNSSHVVGGLSLNVSYFDTNSVSMSGSNVSLVLIGVSSGNYSTSIGGINISNLGSGEYVLLSSSSGYNQNTYTFSIDSSSLSNPLSIYLQPSNVTYNSLITVKDKFSKDVLSGATVIIQRYSNNAWVTEQIYKTDFNGQTQGYFVLNTVYYNFLVVIDGVTYFGVMDSNANKKIVYSEDITNGITIEIDLNPSNAVFDYYDASKVGVSLNFTNTSNSSGYFTYRFSTSDGSSVNGSLVVYRGSSVNCSNSVSTSTGTVFCYVNASSPIIFEAGGFIDGYPRISLFARLGTDNTFNFDWGVLGWFVSLVLVIIGFFAFSSIPSMSLLSGVGILGLLSLCNLIFKGINPLMFIGLLAVAFVIAKIPSRSGSNG